MDFSQKHTFLAPANVLLFKCDALRKIPLFCETEQACFAWHIEIAYFVNIMPITAIAIYGVGMEIVYQRTVGTQNFYVYSFQLLVGKAV